MNLNFIFTKNMTLRKIYAQYLWTFTQYAGAGYRAGWARGRL
jgi:hypothetical protein